MRKSDDLILVDMGSGDRFMPSDGKLWDNLKMAGVDGNKITKVVFTCRSRQRRRGASCSTGLPPTTAS